MQVQKIGINLFNIGVRNDITISPRQAYLGWVCPFASDSEHNSGA